MLESSLKHVCDTIQSAWRKAITNSLMSWQCLPIWAGAGRTDAPLSFRGWDHSTSTYTTTTWLLSQLLVSSSPRLADELKFKPLHGNAAWRPTVQFQQCHLWLFSSVCASIWIFYCTLTLLFYKNEWKMEKWSVDASDKKGSSHKPNRIETKMEIIRRAESRRVLVSIKGSLDLSQLTVSSIVKEGNKTRKHMKLWTKMISKDGVWLGISHTPSVLKLHWFNDRILELEWGRCETGNQENAALISFSFLGLEPSLITCKYAICLLNVRPADFQESIRYERRGCPVDTFSVGVTPAPKPGTRPLISVLEGMQLNRGPCARRFS